MIAALINEMIGPLGRAILNFYFAHQTIINIIFVMWAIMMTYGSVELDKVRKLTVKMGVETLKKNPHQNDEQIWRDFRPVWLEEVEKLKVRYILNRWNLWITKSSPEKLIELLRLGPDWFAAIRNGEVLRYRFSLPGKNDRLKSF
jgi:hypothetical protein